MKKVLALILSLVLILLPLSAVLVSAEGDGEEVTPGYTLDEETKTFIVYTPDANSKTTAARPASPTP